MSDIDAQKRLNLAALPTKQYLESTVVPLLLDGMQALVRERCGSRRPRRLRHTVAPEQR